MNSPRPGATHHRFISFFCLEPQWSPSLFCCPKPGIRDFFSPPAFSFLLIPNAEAPRLQLETDRLPFPDAAPYLSTPSVQQQAKLLPQSAFMGSTAVQPTHLR